MSNENNKYEIKRRPNNRVVEQTLYVKEADLPGDEPDNVELADSSMRGKEPSALPPDGQPRLGVKTAKVQMPANPAPKDESAVQKGQDAAKKTYDAAHKAYDAASKDGNFDVLRALQQSKRAPLTRDELEKERRRERRNKTIAAIGDGLSALANMYYTTKGAPDGTPKTTLSDAARERYDELRKQREQEDKGWYEYWAERQKDAYTASKNARDERRVVLAEKEQERKNKLADAQAGLIQARAENEKNKTDESEAKVAYYEAKTAALAQGADDKHAETQARIAEIAARRRLADARAAHVGQGGSGGVSKTVTKEYEYDDYGAKTKETTTTTTGSSKSSGSSGSKGKGNAYNKGKKKKAYSKK